MHTEVREAIQVMQAFAKWLALIILSLLAMFLIAVMRIPSGMAEHKFDTYAQAAATGAIERQALPDYLPASATDIHSTRDLDHGGEVVTFRYGADFDQFIAAQVAAPPRSAKALGVRLWNDHFTDPDKLSYFPNVVLYREHNPGRLLINRGRRIALYVE